MTTKTSGSTSHNVETEKIKRDTEMLRALYGFESIIPQTLKFSKGDLFLFYPSINKQRKWWHVISVTGQIGYVPSHYVQTVEVGSKFLVDFLTKCVKAVEKDEQLKSIIRKRQLINELMRRRYFLALQIVPQDYTTRVPSQPGVAKPSRPMCSCALVYQSNTATNTRNENL